MRHIDYSEAQCFKFCRQNHYYAYTLGYKPKRTPRHFRIGTAVHVVLERYHAGTLCDAETLDHAITEVWETLCAEEEQVKAFTDYEELSLFEDETLVRGMLHHYAQYYVSDTSFRMLVAEYEFDNLPIPGVDAVLQGRIDGIIVDEEGDYWILEHKTATSLAKPEYLQIEEQSLKYHWAAQKLIADGRIEGIASDVRLQGVLYNELRKSVPKAPTLLKSGALAKNRSVSTTYSVYLSTIQLYGLNPLDYGEYLQELEQQGNTFFQRRWCYHTQAELCMIEQQLHDEVIEMTRPDARVYRSPSKACTECSYFDPCCIARQGGDANWLLQSNYYRTTTRTLEVI